MAETPPPVATPAPVGPFVAPARPTRLAARLPVEVVVALVVGTVYLAGLAAGLPLSLPDEFSVRFVKLHYFSPIIIAGSLQMIVIIASGRKDRSRPLMTLKLVPFITLTVLIHFTFKAWMPLVNPANYDPLYQGIDEALAPVLNAFVAVRTALAGLSPVDVDFAYHTLFVAMFLVSISVHSLVGPVAQQRQVVLGMCLILLVGGAAYCVAPAVGPFQYRPGLNECSTVTQAELLAQYKVVVATGTLPPGYFPCPPAAMPSLHNAHAVFLTLFALRTMRWLGFAYLPVAFWIMIESVASAWHYLADVPVGMAIGVGVFVAVRRLIPDKPAA